jgi:hypothetical protein
MEWCKRIHHGRNALDHNGCSTSLNDLAAAMAFVYRIVRDGNSLL